MQSLGLPWRCEPGLEWHASPGRGQAGRGFWLPPPSGACRHQHLKNIHVPAFRWSGPPTCRPGHQEPMWVLPVETLPFEVRGRCFPSQQASLLWAPHLSGAWPPGGGLRGAGRGPRHGLRSFVRAWDCVHSLTRAGTLRRWFAERSLKSLKLKAGQCV